MVKMNNKIRQRKQQQERREERETVCVIYTVTYPSLMNEISNSLDLNMSLSNLSLSCGICNKFLIQDVQVEVICFPTSFINVLVSSNLCVGSVSLSPITGFITSSIHTRLLVNSSSDLKFLGRTLNMHKSM